MLQYARALQPNIRPALLRVSLYQSGFCQHSHALPLFMMSHAKPLIAI